MASYKRLFFFYWEKNKLKQCRISMCPMQTTGKKVLHQHCIIKQSKETLENCTSTRFEQISEMS